MEQSIKNLVKELNVLEIKPNQALFIKYKGFLEPNIVHMIRDNIANYLGCKVVMLYDNINISVVEIQDENSNN